MRYMTIAAAVACAVAAFVSVALGSESSPQRSGAHSLERVPHDPVRDRLNPETDDALHVRAQHLLPD